MPAFEGLKLAAYIDEAGDDLNSACASFVQHNIHYAVLRNVWAGNICEASDSICQRLKETLNKNNISPIAIISDLGKIEISQLPKISKEKIDRVFNIASYFKVSYVRICVGMSSKTQQGTSSVIGDWIQTITDKCLDGSLVPLLEITPESYLYQPVDIVSMLAKHRRWKLLYDPVQLIIRQNQDPFAKYWTLLKNYCAAIDVRDFKIGHGYKPAGFGDAKIQLTLSDAQKDFNGWYFLEPSLGRRFGNVLTKQGTFKLAIEALETLGFEL